VVYKVACRPLVPKFAGSNPFLGRKNPQHAFLTACKRSLNLRGSRNLGKITTGNLSRPQFHPSLLGSLASLRTQRHVAAKVGTSKGGVKQWQTTPKNLPRTQCAKSHIGSITGLCLLSDRPLGLNTNECMNYKATCFDYRLIILRPILSIVSQDVIVFTSMEYIKLNRLSLRARGANCVYKSGIHQILCM